MFYTEQQSSLPGSPSNGAVSVTLSHGHIANAVLAPEAPSTLDFSKLNLADIPDAAVYELAQIPNNGSGDNDGTIHRLALHKNHLRTLPLSFNLLRRLRYLNLRSNALSYFPEVLSEMESLEILDLSRNKIKAFPITPGTLLQLRVIHLGHNRIGALPNYFPNFRELHLLRIEQNPIEWPPPNVLNLEANGDGDNPTVSQRWIHSIQAWIQDQMSRHDPSYVYNNPSSNQHYDDFDSHRGLTHDRIPSNESVGSHYSSASQSSAPTSPRDRRLANRLGLPDYLDGYSSSDRSASVDHHNVLVPPHVRNASLSLARKQHANGTSLQSKKSLPELRTIQLRSSDRKTKGRPSNAEHEPMPPFPPQHQHSKSKGSISDNNQTIRGPPSSVVNREEPNEMTQPPPMDGERNSYFRRMSTLPASTISKAVPECLLVTVDAARGILFALSQVYSALRHYIVFAINDRLSGVLNKVLDPASQYLHRLITALDRFDGLCRRGTPPPAACRGVLESCRDNITVFSKVIGVLQLQLKVLAGSDDVRYTRTLLMMLYGSAAELSNSWNAMAPHMEAVQELVRDKHSSGSSVEAALPLNLHKQPRAMHSISESDDRTSERTVTSGRAPISAKGRARAVRSTARPHAGSFSAMHVQMGKEMTSALAPVQPLVIQAPSSTTMAMRAVLRQGPAVSSPRSNQSHGSSSMHSPSGSYSSHGHAHGGSRDGDLVQTVTGGSPHNILSSDKDKFVDADTLKSMEESTDLALSVWKQIEDFFDTAGEGSVIGRDYLMRAREVTMSLRSNIRAVLDSSAEEVYGAALWDGANTFSKDVANVLTYVKKTCTERRLPLDASLRADLLKLSHTTQEFVTFLAVSSFAAGKPPASPAPNFAMSPILHDDRGVMQNGGTPQAGLSPSTPLWRSRSAGVIAPSPTTQPPLLNRGPGSAGAGGVYQSSMAAGPTRTGPAHPSLANFRMPPSPAPGGRIRHGGGIVGYKDSD